MPSLQDQLLKQGLADEKQAKAVKRKRNNSRNSASSSPGDAVGQ